MQQIETTNMMDVVQETEQSILEMSFVFHPCSSSSPANRAALAIGNLSLACPAPPPHVIRVMMLSLVVNWSVSDLTHCGFIFGLQAVEAANNKQNSNKELNKTHKCNSNSRPYTYHTNLLYSYHYSVLLGLVQWVIEFWPSIWLLASTPECYHDYSFEQGSGNKKIFSREMMSRV
jgi:hypothetical protein